ncbi:hypothetical protein, partial [Pseudomonas aeruginosa]|uniref:hypothetical protein n=1 Tax=Pseudomonas aeruginosa TaxID=287 RepID=UPI0019D3B80E
KNSTHCPGWVDHYNGPRRAGEETNAGRWDKEKSPSAFLPLAIGADSFNPELATRTASTSH